MVMEAPLDEEFESRFAMLDETAATNADPSGGV